MAAHLVMGGALFAVSIAAGAVIGVWTYWLPRHRLNRIFAECKRARLARLASEHALEQAMT